nr:GAF domain-containing protein [Solirubrobacterales bacterium]
MTFEATPDPAAPKPGPPSVALETETLYAVIGAIASGPNLDRILDGVVSVLSQATGSHACFVYLRDGELLRLRAASSPFSHLVGRVQFGLGEGLAGWVARNGSPAFIPDDAMADPRMKFVPELHEERFQSLAAVPIPARSGRCIGVVVLHTVAPHEFDEGVLTLVGHTASLVAGAIENAQLYEDSRRRVRSLTMLSTLSQQIAAVTGREELGVVVSGGVQSLLDCERCELYLLDADSGRLEAADGDGPPDDPAAGATVLVDLLR